jgi:CheY-like chemotaxis protein
LQACRLALKEKPSVIIADNYMPGGDAQYLLYRLRATPATADIPVVVISGNKLNELTERMLKREICGRPGALQIFRKSFDTDALFAVLQKFCSFKKARALPAG